MNRTRVRIFADVAVLKGLRCVISTIFHSSLDHFSIEKKKLHSISYLDMYWLEKRVQWLGNVSSIWVFFLSSLEKIHKNTKCWFFRVVQYLSDTFLRYFQYLRRFCWKTPKKSAAFWECLMSRMYVKNSSNIYRVS